MLARGPKTCSATDPLALRLGWIGLIGGLLLQALTYLLAFAAPGLSVIPWLSIAGILAALTGTMILGAVRQGRLSPAATIAVISMFAVLAVGFGAALALPAETANGPLWLGLPRRAAIVLLGVGVLPMLILTLAYAFDHREDQDQ